MDKQNEEFVDLKKIKSIQNAFEDSMKLLEKNVAECIINKQMLQTMKEDMLEANKKFKEAEDCLESLKLKIKN